MKSPITGKEMKLVRELAKFQFRKEDFEILYHYYLCDQSKESFTNDKLDKINQIQVHNKYREKYGIPFPEEIVAIKEKYGVTSSKMSEILGFGTNTYRLYEDEEMPSVSNGRLILSIIQPEEFIRQVNASSHILTTKEVEKFVNRAKEIEQHESYKNIGSSILISNLLSDKPSEYSGYKKLSIEKAMSVIYYLGNHIELYKTKLNKLLFYTDFLFYQEFGTSITGLKYRAIPFGPVPSDFDKLYLKLQEDNKIEIQEVAFDNGHYGDIIRPLNNNYNGLCSIEEQQVLDKVIDRFRNLSSRQIADVSHNEKAWLENIEEKNIISYQKYSYNLNAFD
jgi:uncharacterized phage-associated protein